MEEIINWCIDEPDERDYLFEEVFGDIEPKKVEYPIKDLIIRDQSWTGACTRYWLGHICNAQNILERWKNYKQIDPRQYRDAYCQERGYTGGGATLQSWLKQFKDAWVIEWYVKVTTKDQIKKAIDNWQLIYLGSNDGDWVEIRRTGLYSRQSAYIVWHAFCWGFEYDDTYILLANSYWPNRWPLNWYFKMDWDTFLNHTFTKYAIIDKKTKPALDNYKKKIYLKKILTDIENAKNYGWSLKYVEDLEKARLSFLPYWQKLQ